MLGVHGHSVTVWVQLLCTSVYIRKDPVGDTSAVGVPCNSIFVPALSLITGFSMNQQDGEIYNIEIRQEMCKTYGEKKINKTG